MKMNKKEEYLDILQFLQLTIDFLQNREEHQISSKYIAKSRKKILDRLKKLHIEDVL